VLGFYQEEDTINMPRNVTMFEVDECDDLVTSTYGRIYLEEYRHELFLYRNFYPHVSLIIKDLESKGILKEGEYIISIDY